MRLTIYNSNEEASAEMKTGGAARRKNEPNGMDLKIET